MQTLLSQSHNSVNIVRPS